MTYARTVLQEGAYFSISPLNVKDSMWQHCRIVIAGLDPRKIQKCWAPSSIEWQSPTALILVFFYAPPLDTVISAPQVLVDADGKRRYKSFTWPEYLQYQRDKMFEKGKDEAWLEAFALWSAVVRHNYASGTKTLTRHCAGVLSFVRHVFRSMANYSMKKIWARICYQAIGTKKLNSKGTDRCPCHAHHSHQVAAFGTLSPKLDEDNQHTVTPWPMLYGGRGHGAVGQLTRFCTWCGQHT